MFAAEREKKIKEILLEYKHIDVNTLCSLLSCSIATVRRDLEKLETEGFLTKAYGGAILKEESDQHVTIAGSGDPYMESKDQAARIAVNLIQDGDVIFLGPGSTCTCLAKHLRSRQNLIVVTTNLNAAIELSGAPRINVILAGGSLEEVSPGFSSTSGHQAISFISSMRISKAFFTVDGISLDYGYSSNLFSQCDLTRTILRQANTSYIIADSSKFGVNALMKIADLNEIDNLITNVDISAEYKEFFFTNKIKLYTSFDKSF